MLTDRTTARVLGLLVLVLTVLVDVSCFVFARPEVRQTSRFALVVALTSLPLAVVGLLLLRKASRMPPDEADEANERDAAPRISRRG